MITKYDEMFCHQTVTTFDTPFRAAVVILSVQKNLQKMGIDLPGDDPMVDNFCTRKLADLLNLPAPGASKKAVAGREDLSGTVQFYITGPEGEEWYIVVEKGEAVRHGGTIENPDVRVTVTTQDWADIVSGKIDRFNARTSGKMTIAGDNSLYQKLADTIAKVCGMA